MGLSNDLISQFVKVTIDKQSKPTESTVYGTVVKYGDSMYVKLDGSDILTPMTSTTDIKDGERVTVMIKDHSATITGNITSPSASKQEVTELGNKVVSQQNDITLINNDITSINNNITSQGNTIKEQNNTITSINNTVTSQGNKITEIDNTVTAQENTITSINNTVTSQGNKITEIDNEVTSQSNKITSIGNIVNEQDNTIEVINNNIGIYNSSFQITDGIVTGIKGVDTDWIKTKDLESDHATIGSLDTKYANIDFANINEAAIEKLFSDSGIIKDLVVSEGHITGELVGVTIKGDLIEGGTVKADKLVVMGSDGLYYKLNVNGETVESEQTEYNSLDGSVITAKSITATKISVDDLVAFGATIGGFKITSNSIYSGVKSSVGNTTRGIYQDNDGQFYVGDSDNFLKFYKDSSGNYKLEISADSMMFSSTKKSVETVINEAVEDISSDINNLDQKTDDNLNSVGDRISLAESAILQLNDSISMLVTDADGTSLMTQTSTGWQFNISSLQNSLNKASDNIDSLLNTTGDINETVNSLNQAVDDLGAKSEYINIGVYEDEPCIELGESDSIFKLLITNTKIMFQNGSEIPTHINTKGLVTENIQINNELSQGGFVWQIHGSGNLGLMWKGEDS